jgi:ParB family chromosome partitioning protein
MQKRGLGKGLSALIPEKEHGGEEKILYIKADDIRASRYQPRTEFDTEKLDELVASIEEKGVIAPILVRPMDSGGYELIAGERRLRAVKRLGLPEIPAIIKLVTDTEMLQLSLIENVQREGLNPIEEAHAYQRLIDEFSFTQEKIGQSIGKDRSSVANILRLLKLPKKVQEAVSRGTITMGHARALLSLEDTKSQIELCERIIARGLSVRGTEEAVGKKKTDISKKRLVIDHHISSIENELQQLLATKVKITYRKGRGKINIEYYSDTDLDRILGLIKPKDKII